MAVQTHAPGYSSHIMTCYLQATSFVQNPTWFTVFYELFRASLMALQNVYYFNRSENMSELLIKPAMNEKLSTDLFWSSDCFQDRYQCHWDSERESGWSSQTRNLMATLDVFFFSLLGWKIVNTELRGVCLCTSLITTFFFFLPILLPPNSLWGDQLSDCLWNLKCTWELKGICLVECVLFGQYPKTIASLSFFQQFLPQTYFSERESDIVQRTSYEPFPDSISTERTMW